MRNRRLPKSPKKKIRLKRIRHLEKPVAAKEMWEDYGHRIERATAPRLKGCDALQKGMRLVPASIADSAFARAITAAATRPIDSLPEDDLNLDPADAPSKIASPLEPFIPEPRPRRRRSRTTPATGEKGDLPDDSHLLADSLAETAIGPPPPQHYPDEEFKRNFREGRMNRPHTPRNWDRYLGYRSKETHNKYLAYRTDDFLRRVVQNLASYFVQELTLLPAFHDPERFRRALFERVEQRRHWLNWVLKDPLQLSRRRSRAVEARRRSKVLREPFLSSPDFFFETTYFSSLVKQRGNIAERQVIRWIQSADATSGNDGESERGGKDLGIAARALAFAFRFASSEVRGDVPKSAGAYLIGISADTWERARTSLEQLLYGPQATLRSVA